MKAEQKISVVIPTYNRAKLIKRTLDSVLNQSHQNIEIIVVDDFSSDIKDLELVISNYNDSRINLLIHKSNRHGSAARNTGITAATGEYIALLDSDDIWAPNKLENCLKVIKEQRQVVYSAFYVKGISRPDRELRANESVGDYLLISKQAIQTSTIFLHTQFAKEVMFDESLVRFQDYDFTIRLDKAGASFTMLPMPLVEMLDDNSGTRISNNVDYNPAIFWLNKIAPLISPQAQYHFYLNRVVRLMVIGGNQEQIFKKMPKIVRSQLSIKSSIKLQVFCKMPSFVWKTVVSVYKFIKKW